MQLLLKKGEVQRHSVCINEVVQDVLKLMRSELINQNVRADFKLARNLPSVTGDLVQLQQVLLNLVSMLVTHGRLRPFGAQGPTIAELQTNVAASCHPIAELPCLLRKPFPKALGETAK